MTQRIHSATLVVTLPDGTRLRHRLTAEETVVGRAQQCDLVLPDNSVSRRHALFVLSAGELVVQDLGSANGVVVAGRRVERLTLGHGDQLKLGRAEISVELEYAPEAEAEVAEEATVVKKGPPPGAAAAAAARSPEDARRRRFYLLAGGILVVGLAVIIGAGMIMRARQAPPPPAAPPAKPAPAPPPAPTPTAPKPPASPPPAAGAPAAPAPAAPAAPTPRAPRAGAPAPSAPAPTQLAPAAQADAARHIQQGDVYRETGRLLDAVSEYQAALKLEPNNAEAKRKLAETQKEIQSKAEAFLARGLQNYKYLKYESAIQDWMRVLYLIPDQDHPLHRKAVEYIEQARSKLSR